MKACFRNQRLVRRCLGIGQFWSRCTRHQRMVSLSFVAGWCIAGLLPWVLALLVTFLPLSVGAQETFGQTSPAEQGIEFARTLNQQTTVELKAGQSEKALASSRTAAEAYRSAGDLQGELRAQLNQAQALRDLGFHQRALKTIEQVLFRLAGQPDSLLKAIALQRQGDLYRLVGELNDAQAKLESSLVMLQQLNATASSSLQLMTAMGAAQLSLGEIAQDQGEWETAIAQYAKVIELPLPIEQKSLAQLAELKIWIEQGNGTKADALWPKIKQQLASLPASHRKRYSQIHLAEMLISYRPRQHSQEAAHLLKQAANEAASLGDSRAQAYALGYLGQRYEQHRQWPEAERLTQTALRLSESLDASEMSYRWLWQLGRIRAQQGHRADAIAFYRQALDQLQKLRQDFVTVNTDIQFSFRQDIEPLYRELADLLLQTPNQQANPSQLAEVQAVIESLQVAELENFLRKNCDNTAVEAIDQVDDKAAVIYPIILRDRLELILSLPGLPLQRYTASVSQEQLQKTIRQFRHGLSIRSRRRFLQPSQQLYQWLIQPIAQELKQQGIETLVFVPDGELKNIPMATLHDGTAFLIEQYQIAVTPGLNLFAPQPLRSNNLSVMAAGISQASQGFPPLNHVTDELTSIQKSASNSKVLLDSQFTTPALQSQLSQLSASIVHFATHGQFSSDAGRTFVLAWDAPIPLKQFDQLLRSVPNGIELLVLSACETAAGDDNAALGLAGVAVDAGANSTLATLWSVDDAASASFMKVFYQTLNQPGSTRANALRQAQLSLLRDAQFQHPFYWAPYMMIGNWL